MVNRSPIRDHGDSHLMNTSLYHLRPAILRIMYRVTIAAPRGIPRKTATLLATVEYSMDMVPSARLMTFMKRRARGA